jgi:hypothetical protein
LDAERRNKTDNFCARSFPVLSTGRVLRRVFRVVGDAGADKKKKQQPKAAAAILAVEEAAEPVPWWRSLPHR